MGSVGSGISQRECGNVAGTGFSLTSQELAGLDKIGR
jgi:hypothetical protein